MGFRGQIGNTFQQANVTGANIKDADVMNALPTQYPTANDPSFQPVPAMPLQQIGQQQAQPTSPYQQLAYQQAQVVQAPGGMPTATETQVQQKVIDPRLAKQEAEAATMAASAQRAQATAMEEENRIRAIGYKKLSDDMEMKQAEYNKVMEEFKGQKLLDPQDKWGTGGKIGAAISMALGAFAATYSGGRNYAADIIDGAIKRDVDMQEAAIRKLGMDAQGAQNALATAYRKLGDMAQARNAVEMAALANVGDDIMMQAKKSDNQKVQANAQAAIAALKQKEAARASQQNEMTIATAGKPMIAAGGPGGVGGKAMTEFEGKAYAGALAMEKADQAIARLEQVGTEASTHLPMFEGLKGKDRKLYEQAALEFEQSFDRVVSGANITADEAAKTIKRVMPAWNDPPEVLKTKAESRRLLIQGVQTMAGMQRAGASTQAQQNEFAKIKQQLGFSK